VNNLVLQAMLRRTNYYFLLLRRQSHEKATVTLPKIFALLKQLFYFSLQLQQQFC